MEGEEKRDRGEIAEGKRRKNIRESSITELGARTHSSLTVEDSDAHFLLAKCGTTIDA